MSSRIFSLDDTVRFARSLAAVVLSSPEKFVDVPEQMIYEMSPQQKLLFTPLPDRRVIRITTIGAEVEIRVVGASEPSEKSESSATMPPGEKKQRVVRHTDEELAQLELEQERQRKLRKLEQSMKTEGPMRVTIA